MKDMVQKIPGILQRAIAVRVGSSILALVVSVCLLVQFGRLTVAAPLLLAALLLAGHAAYIGWLSVTGHCFELQGTVLGVEWSLFRDKPKALLLEAQGKALRVILHGRIKAPAVGSDIVLYIPDSAMLYEWRGMHQINSYLALKPYC